MRMSAICTVARYRHPSLSYLVATARNCLRRFISRSMVLRCLYRCGRKVGGRPPSDPFRARLAFWSAFSGMSCGIRRARSARRLPREL